MHFGHAEVLVQVLGLQKADIPASSALQDAGTGHCADGAFAVRRSLLGASSDLGFWQQHLPKLEEAGVWFLYLDLRFFCRHMLARNN
jgi:hypothetical protein